MKVHVLRSAVNDLAKARKFYDRQEAGIGDYFFDIYSFFAYKIFDDRSDNKSYQSKVSKIFHNIPNLPKIDIHMKKCPIHKIIRHEFTRKDS